MVRKLIVVLAASGMVAATTVPASAQLDDFLCSTFSYKCAPPPPPPPPTLAPTAEPAAVAPVKHAHRVHKKKVKHTAAPADTGTDTSAPAPAAPDAAPK